MDEQQLKQQAEKIVEKIKELVKDGSASKIALKRKGETLVNIPLGAGILGAIVGLSAAPFAVLTTALISLPDAWASSRTSSSSASFCAMLPACMLWRITTWKGSSCRRLATMRSYVGPPPTRCRVAS